MVGAAGGLATMSRDAFLVGVPKLVGGVTLIGLNLAIAGALPPAEYGVFAFGLSAVLLIDSAFGAAVDLAVLRSAAGSSDVAAYERAGLAFKTLVVGSAALVAALFGEAFGWRAFNAPGGRVLFVLTVAAAAGLLLLRSAQTHWQLAASFGRFGAIDLAHTTLRIALVCAVILLGAATPTSVLACYAAAAIVVGCAGAARTLGIRKGALRSDGIRVRELWRFIRVAGATFAVGAIVTRLDLFALAVAGTPHDLGVYGAALTLATVPELLGTYLAPAFTPRVVAHRQDPRFAVMFRRAQAVLVAVAGGVLVCGWLFAGSLVQVALPDSYAGSTLLLKVLLVAGLAAFVTFPLALHFVMCASPRTFLLMDALTAPALLAAYLLAAKFNGALGVACVTAGARAVKATYIQALAARLARQSAIPVIPVAPLAAAVR